MMVYRSPHMRMAPMMRIGAVGLCLAAASAIASAQWLHEAYDAARTYANTAETVITPDNVSQLKRLWRTRVFDDGTGPVASSATESGDLMFTCQGGNELVLKAISSLSGSVVWEQSSLGADACSAATLSGSTAYLTLAGLAGQNVPTNGLSAVDQTTGAIQWQSSWSTNEGSVNYPLETAIVDGRIYLSDRYENVRALDAATGAVLWQNRTGTDVVNNAVAVADGRVFVTTWGDHDGADVIKPGIYAFDAASGQLLWSNLIDTDYIGTPAMVLGDTVICFCGSLVAYRASDGQELWRRTRTEPGSSRADPVGQGNTLYVPSYAGRVVALNANTGEVRWSSPPKGLYDRVETNMVWANGVLFLLIHKPLGEKFILRALDALTGRSLASFAVEPEEFDELNATGLTVVDGRVQIGFYYYVGGQSKSPSFLAALGFGP